VWVFDGVHRGCAWGFAREGLWGITVESQQQVMFIHAPLVG